jgi:hypothetical protein
VRKPTSVAAMAREIRIDGVALRSIRRLTAEAFDAALSNGR